MVRYWDLSFQRFFLTTAKNINYRKKQKLKSILLEKINGVEAVETII